MNIKKTLLLFVAFTAPALSNITCATPLDSLKENSSWNTATAVNAVGSKLQISSKNKNDEIVWGDNKSSTLFSKAYIGDALIEFDYLAPKDSAATFYLQGRYAIALGSNANEWQHMRIKYRAGRFDQALTKKENGLLIELRINGELAKLNGEPQKNILLTSISPGAPQSWEDPLGSEAFVVNKGQLALRNISIQTADFSALKLPTESGKATNEGELVDFVALGKETFESFGCNVCHTISTDNTAVSTGPNLYGLFMQTPRTREIVEGGENHRFTIKADNSYLHRSLRTPSEQLAVAEQGAKKGDAYPAIMPPFSTQVLSDLQIDAVGAYLATQNDIKNRGPAIKLMQQSGQQAYDPVADGLQMLVDKQTRIQRGPMEGTSGRAIHVGFGNSINYSFDPRILAIVKIWQGGFLDMSGEWLNRGGKGLKTGYESREIDLGSSHALLSPIHQNGTPIDFSFKDAIFRDVQTAQAAMNSTQDHLDRIAQEDAQFLGYELNSKAPESAPSFRYRIGKNTMTTKTTISDSGNVEIEVRAQLKSSQSFVVNNEALTQINITSGTFSGQQWSLPAGTTKAYLRGKLNLAGKSWHAPASHFDNRLQPIKITPATAAMPAGYSIESYYPPKDNFGREQLFEALGLAVAEDGTIVVATRTAGIWRIVKGQWHLFAEGTFDSLGVVIEDKKGLQLVVGQKAELTRISDTNGDGLADSYQTLFDAHSYHGNYHSYMHGPVRGGDGAYYININLADTSDGSGYRAGGAYMGSQGGFSGWNFRVQADGKLEPWAYGLRSPAGLGVANDGRLWYSENQGEFVGTSKIFVIKKDGFYGHPASLIDLPGMTPSSPEIAWDKYAGKRELPVILLPHNKVANSPGNLAWDTTNGKFGPFSGQILIGDQTQSNLMRVDTETVAGMEQGVLIPFMKGLESGVMRPLFLPDGSLLLGQTGRGWQAKGGKVASLQRVVWDGKTIAPGLQTVRATQNGFNVQLTQPLAEHIDPSRLAPMVAVESWVYRDAPDYGSDELGLTKEAVASIAISTDRKQITIALDKLEHKSEHPQQTARVYHIALNGKDIFNPGTDADLHAYYTLYKFASAE